MFMDLNENLINIIEQRLNSDTLNIISINYDIFEILMSIIRDFYCFIRNN